MSILLVLDAAKQLKIVVRAGAGYDNIEDFLMFMLKEFDDKGETTMFAPAPGFYATKGLGGNEMRIAYVLTPDKMRRACELIKLGVEAYNNR